MRAQQVGRSLLLFLVGTPPSVTAGQLVEKRDDSL